MRKNQHSHHLIKRNGGDGFIDILVLQGRVGDPEIAEVPRVIFGFLEGEVSDGQESRFHARGEFHERDEELPELEAAEGEADGQLTALEQEFHRRHADRRRREALMGFWGAKWDITVIQNFLKSGC